MKIFSKDKQRELEIIFEKWNLLEKRNVEKSKRAGLSHNGTMNSEWKRVDR